MSGNTNKELNTFKLSVKNVSTSRTAVAKISANAVKLKTVAAKSVSNTRAATLTTPKCRPAFSNQKAILQTENKCGSTSNLKKPDVSIKRAQSAQSIANSTSNRSRKIESNPTGRLTKRCSSLQAVCDKTVHKGHIPEKSTQNKNELKSKQLLNMDKEVLESISEIALKEVIHECETEKLIFNNEALKKQNGHKEPMDEGTERNFCHEDRQVFHDLVQRIQTLQVNKMELEEELGRKSAEIIELRTVTSQLVEERNDSSYTIERLVSKLELTKTKCFELEAELKETVRQFQLDKQEWKQFQKDLQTAVVVADGVRAEAQEELSKAMAQNRELKDFVTALKGELQEAQHRRLQQNFDPINLKNKLDVLLTPHKKSTISGYLASDVKALDLKVEQNSTVTAATRKKLPSEEQKPFCTRTALTNMTTNLMKSNVQSPGHCCKRLSLFQHSSSPVNQKRDTSLETSLKQQGTRWPTGCSASPASHLVSLAVVSDDVKQAAVESVFTRSNKENLADNKRLPLADILTNKLTKKKCSTTNVLRSVHFNLLRFKICTLVLIPVVLFAAVCMYICLSFVYL